MSPRINLDLDTLLDEAIKIANHQGIEAVTLASLAKELNIKSPSLYNHIDGLQGLRKQLALRGLKELYNELANSIIGLSDDEAIHRLSKAYVAFVRSQSGLYEATLMAPDSKDEEVQEAGEKIVNLVLSVLEPYKLKAEESIHIVRGLRSILHGFASLELKSGFGLPLNLDESLNLIIDTFLIGIHNMDK